MSEALKNGPRMLPYVSAITEAVRQVLEEQDNAFVAGEDVGQGEVRRLRRVRPQWRRCPQVGSCIRG